MGHCPRYRTNYCKLVTPISKESDLFTCKGEIGLDAALYNNHIVRSMIGLHALETMNNLYHNMDIRWNVAEVNTESAMRG